MASSKRVHTGPFDLVLCTDVLFSENAIGLLVDTICSVCENHTVVLTSNEHRWEGAAQFYLLLEERGFSFDRVPTDFHVYRAQRQVRADWTCRPLDESVKERSN